MLVAAKVLFHLFAISFQCSALERLFRHSVPIDTVLETKFKGRLTVREKAQAQKRRDTTNAGRELKSASGLRLFEDGKMIRISKYLFLFMLACQFVDGVSAQSGQTIIIEGIVKPNIGNPVVAAQVKVMDLANSNVVDSTITDAAGFYHLEIGTLTDVETPGAVPKSFSLSQNYPNPFFQNTKIGFTTGEKGNAKLEVYNVLGQRVITLFDNYTSPNRFIVNWDGRDFQGNKIAEGIYFYRLTFDGQIITKKMLFRNGEILAPRLSTIAYQNSNPDTYSFPKINEGQNFQITVSHPTIVTITDTLETNTNESTYIVNYTTTYSNFPGHPSDVIPFFDKWKITLGSGSSVRNLVNYEHGDYFYNANDGIDWVVYKTPNSGGTTPNSSNTRSELRQISEWTPETGGKLTGTLKVMHVSTSGDARVPATFSVVLGQIHSSEGHENEPLKIFYKKFPGHTRGSVFWNYEINTDGDNSERWDYSTAVWGYDWSVVGSSPTSYPEEPPDGIELGEEFSYEVNVYNGTMYLTFTSRGHPTKTFEKNLVSSEYTSYSDIPQQVLAVFNTTGQDGTERPNAYAGELQYFKQGAYNQTNGKAPADNMVWNTGAETYGGNLAEQYAKGSYAEVWFKAATVGPGASR